MSELKPCVFCDNKVIIGDDCFGLTLITCTNCNVNTRYYSQLPRCEIIKHWNTRYCDKCDKIENWADNAGFKPVKVARYEKLLTLVRMIADKENQEFDWYNDAKELLKEIGEYHEP